jgi:recombination protein RecA
MGSVNSLRAQIEAFLEARIPSALGVRAKFNPEIVSTGIPELDQQTGGIPRGCLTEICGPTSSGRTTVVLSLMREITRQGECCALIDNSNAFDPLSAFTQGVDLRRVLWIRCNSRHCVGTATGDALRVTDWVINAGGFGLIVLDLGDVTEKITGRIPRSYWFKYRRSVDGTRAAFLVVGQHAMAKSCATLALQLQTLSSEWTLMSGSRNHPQLFTGAQVTAKMLRTRSQSAEAYDRKPQSSVTKFSLATAWAG